MTKQNIPLRFLSALLLIMLHIVAGCGSSSISDNEADSASMSDTDPTILYQILVKDLGLDLVEAGLTEAQASALQEGAIAYINSNNLASSESISVVAPVILQGSLIATGATATGLTDATSKTTAINTSLASLLQALNGRVIADTTTDSAALTKQDIQVPLSETSAAYAAILKSLSLTVVQNLGNAGVTSEDMTTVITAVVQIVSQNLATAGVVAEDYAAVTRSIVEGAVSGLGTLGYDSTTIGDAVGAVTSGAFNGLLNMGLDTTTIGSIADEVTSGAIAGLDNTVLTSSEIASISSSIVSSVINGLESVGLTAEEISAIETELNTAAGIVPPVPPEVTSITPADQATDMALSTTINVIFSKSMDSSSITTNTATTNCTGSFLVSANDFTSCVQMTTASPVASTNNTVFTLTPTSNLAYETTYKIKVTTAVLDSDGNAMESEYLTENGFTTVDQTFDVLIVDTGQATCYDLSEPITCPGSGEDFYGQDAQYSINPPSTSNYTDNGDTITDKTTGLEWWQEGNLYSEQIAVAITTCNDSTLYSKDDWRLPTVKELFTLLSNYSGSPMINAVFTNTSANSNHASTPNVSASDEYWNVRFNIGSLLSLGTTFSLNFRCVRGTAGLYSNSFIDKGNGVVVDESTGLHWQQEELTAKKYWKAALAYCESLTFGGKSDWRLPGIKALQSLVDYSSYNPAINIGTFTNVKFDSSTGEEYWSSTTYHGLDHTAWSIDFYDGSVENEAKAEDAGNERRVRCVRSD
jgi:uncharacterized protein DUF1566/Big-like domain-containing protein